jgi:Raf kinase inhibitor-like YbhB/YbcL family protein
MRRLLSALAGVVLLTGCSAGNGTKAEKGPLALDSPAFRAGATIPINYSCLGADTSPPIVWHGATPAGTKSWAVVLTDGDVRPGPWIQWLVTDVPLSTRSMPVGIVPAEAVVHRASNGTAGFVGACPPAGERHHYTFTLYAVGKHLNLGAVTSAMQTLRSVAAASVAHTTISASFAR